MAQELRRAGKNVAPMHVWAVCLSVCMGASPVMKNPAGIHSCAIHQMSWARSLFVQSRNSTVWVCVLVWFLIISTIDSKLFNRIYTHTCLEKRDRKEFLLLAWVSILVSFYFFIFSRRRKRQYQTFQWTRLFVTYCKIVKFIINCRGNLSCTFDVCVRSVFFCEKKWFHITYDFFTIFVLYLNWKAIIHSIESMVQTSIYTLTAHTGTHEKWALTWLRWANMRKKCQSR